MPLPESEAIPPLPSPEDIINAKSDDKKDARRRLMESIIQAGVKAFDPEGPSGSRDQAIHEFDELIESIKILNLLGALNILVRPGNAPKWLRPKLMEKLTLVPLRPNGVRGTLEFVFSVHPSSTVKVSEAAVPQKRGANITHEALSLASNLLSAPPASVTPEKWYSTIAPQLLVLLDGGEGPELVKAAAYVIGFGILGRKASGAPGTAGWKFLAEPILNCIKPPPGQTLVQSDVESDGVVDLTVDKVVVPYDQLVTSLRRLKSLVVSHPNPGLCKRLLHPLLLPLWTLASWHSPPQSLSEQVCTPAVELLKIFLKLSPSPGLIIFLAQNMGYLGGYDRNRPEWVYKAVREGEIDIVDVRHRIGSEAGLVPTLEDIERKTPRLLDLIGSSLTDADISGAFLELLKRWLKSQPKSETIIMIQEKGDEQEDPVAKMAELKTLYSMMEKFPDKLATQPKHILDLVSQILSNSTAQSRNDDEEVAGVALSLLNMIITVPGFQKSRVDPDILSSIEIALDKLSKGSNSLSQTANNLRLLLLYRDEIEPPSSTAAPTDRQIEDRKTYALAIQYITQPDNPPPVRSEGLNLIGGLITARSPVLDIPGILVLLSRLMSDADEYIYLRVIKLYTLLANNHPRAVTTELVDHFVDLHEMHQQVDTRLRFGEALLQVVQRMGETFMGEIATRVGQALLSIASRRGRRPKTEARQRREAKLREMKNREAAEAWGGEVPEFSDDDEGMTEEEKKRNEIIAKIVEGWESKRGTEDVRVRASALGVLGAAVEVNVAGLGPTLVTTAVDLCINVLTMEPEMEKGILRRAAIMLVMSFIRALEEARQAGKRLGTFGFGHEAQEDMMRTLRYVAATDNDGLVVQHAKDVVESLENWQVVQLLPPEREQAQGVGALGGLTKLRGLEVDPQRSVKVKEEESPGGRRIVIEEIE